ncbi:hypothetical protein A3709_00105 [Halioglobus sp. HI00S01]|uniref:patatin-like phospholipase family protein n=1 Tax=Halioglobus sp. HI00S01 TaxID=1822214 RepID=UPI0007C36C51|nr:patatin-like phospholipase family protein [Halioglobus sp. HI00S01]KZX60517.1 hypothetical protein A3709_00105 [Halioglobus sp. HI00S01]
MTSTTRAPIKNAIFAGGGSRCLWQVGFWDGANSAGLGLQDSVDYAASTSAGCAMATACMLGRGAEALAMFKVLTDQNPANIHWHNLKPGSGAPLLPHMNMYRHALKHFLTEDDLQALAGRKLEFLMARFPAWLPNAIGTPLAFSIYGLEKHLTGVLHPNWTSKLGFEPLRYGNQNAATIADLIDTILASSCVPPVLPFGRYRGMRVLDGGIIDNVPAFMADDREGNTLVLLSKRYRQALPTSDTRIYVQPSEQIHLDKFDYANPQGLQDTYDLGYADGKTYTSQHWENTPKGITL